jgi:hypothetical protein
VANAAFSKKTLFTSKLDLKLGKKLVKCYIWSVAFILQKLDTWESRREIISTFLSVLFEKAGEDYCTDHVENEEL